MIRSRLLQLAGAAATAIFIAACQPGESQGPIGDDLSFDPELRFVSSPQVIPVLSVPQQRAYPGTKVAGEASVCKDASSPIGHYHFVITAVNAQPGDMVADTVTLTPGQCAIIYNRVNRNPKGGPLTHVHIAEAIPPGSNYQLDHVIRDDDVSGSQNQPGPSVTVSVNSNHGAFANFFNTPLQNGTGGASHHPPTTNTPTHHPPTTNTPTHHPPTTNTPPHHTPTTNTNKNH